MNKNNNMKKITLILAILTITLISCDNMGKKTNSQNCQTRFDVKLKDGSAIWVYGGSVNEGYVKGNDEMGQTIYIPMSQVDMITKVDCLNRK